MELINIFIGIFLAELGDKTQIATVAFATDRSVHGGLVFAAAAAALICSSALAVLLGRAAGHYLEILPMKLIAGSVFIAIGLWYFVDHFRNGATA